MRSAFAIALVLTFVGCGDDTGTTPGDAGADAPQLPDSSFRDAPAPDSPPQQMDAAPPQFNDGGAFNTPTTPNRVGCPPGNSCDSTTSHCCSSGGLPSCVDNAVDGGSCSSLNEGCDGTEDCGAGAVCCGTMAGAGLTSSCATGTACPTGQFQLCHNHTQCPASAPACCTGSFMGFMLWFGACVPPGMAPNGSQCDIP